MRYIQMVQLNLRFRLIIISRSGKSKPYLFLSAFEIIFDYFCLTICGFIITFHIHIIAQVLSAAKAAFIGGVTYTLSKFIEM